MRPTVGILGYQGCIEPHEAILDKLKTPHIRVRTTTDLSLVDRLILPGGESTTMLRFMKLANMVEPLRLFAKSNPVWGICAGSILAATEVINPSQDSLKIIDITAHRNFYGSQLDSFTTEVKLDLLDKPIEVNFIRAPLLSPCKKQVIATTENMPLRVHGYINDQPVFFSQGSVWASSFHVELGANTALHELFLTQRSQ